MKIRITATVVLFAGFVASFAAEPASKSGIDKSNFDPAVRPQDDLFRSVNGKWLKEATIPPDRAQDGAMLDVRDRSEKQVRAIIEEFAKTATDPDSKKISALYESFMDEAQANKLGMTP